MVKASCLGKHSKVPGIKVKDPRLGGDSVFVSLAAQGPWRSATRGFLAVICGKVTYLYADTVGVLDV